MFSSLYSLVSSGQQIRRVWRHHGLEGVGARVWARVKQVFRALEEAPLSPAEQEWILKQQPEARESYEAALSSFSYTPQISLLCPVCDPPIAFLQELIASVREQVYPNWQLCIADDDSQNPEVKKLLKKIASEDERIQVVFRESRGHIAKATQSALDLASGEFVALIDHDDVIPLHALFSVVQLLQKETDVDILYSDEAKLSSSGTLFEPSVKPDWSPMYFRSFMYTGHLTVYRKTLVDGVGGFQEGLDGSQDYALFLAASKNTDRIVHIPRILYYWRSHAGSVAGDIHSKSYAFQNARKALKKNLEQQSLRFPLEMHDGPYPGLTRYQATGDLVHQIAWTAGQSHEGLLNELAQVEKDYVYLSPGSTEKLSAQQLQMLVAPLAFPEVGVTSPLLLRETGSRVFAAGYSKLPSGYAPNLDGDSLTTGGPGHRLYVPFEVHAVPLAAVCMEKEALIGMLQSEEYRSVLNQAPEAPPTLAVAGSAVVVPDVRVRTNKDAKNLLLTPSVEKRYYPVGVSMKRASFRFE